MKDLGFIKTVLSEDHHDNDSIKAIDSDEIGFAWKLPSGAWNGWFSTKIEAINDAPTNAFIVEKRITQRVCGRK